MMMMVTVYANQTTSHQIVVTAQQAMTHTSSIGIQILKNARVSLNFLLFMIEMIKIIDAWVSLEGIQECHNLF